MPLHCIFLPCFRLIGAILLGGFLALVSVSASATTCTNTSNGALNDPAIYGKFQNSRQDAGCGSDLSLNYTVALRTNVSWDGVGGVLRGGLVNQGTLNLHAPVELEGFLENEGTLNLISEDSSAEVNFKGGWVNRGTFSADSVVLHWQEASRIENGTVGLTSVSLKVSGKVQKIGGVLNASSSNLELSGRTEWMVPESLTFSGLDLNGNTLLLGDNETELQFSQQVSLNHSSDQIILGRGSLKLDGGLQLEQGYLSVSGGSLELSGASKVESEGLLNLADGRFVLQAPFTVKGTLRMNSGTEIQGVSKISLDGGILESSGSLLLDQLEFQGNSRIRLLADTEIDSASPISLETIEFQKNHLRLVSETTDLTLDNLSVFAEEDKGLDTGPADLTVSGPLVVQSGRLASSGGKLSFFGTAQFGPVQSILELDNSTLDLSSELQLSSVFRFGGDSVLPGDDLLDLSGASIELGGNLNLEGIKTDNTTFVELKDNSSISSNRPIELGRLMPHGHTLELGSAETELSLLGIGEPPELPEGNGNPTINLSPVIESLNAERLQDGGLKWSVVISDDSAFSSLTTHWEYLFGGSREFSSPSYIPSMGSQSGTVEVVMTDYDDSDSGMLLLTVCDQASDHDGECDLQKEGATTLSFELIPYAYELPLICEDQDCTQTLDGPPANLSNPSSSNSIQSLQDNQTSGSEGGSILLKGGVLQIQEKLTLSGSLIETGGGSLVLHDGALLIQGSSLKLDNGTLELGDNLELDNSSLHADASVLRLLDHVSLVIPADISFKEIQLQLKTLALDSSVTSLTLTEQLILDHAQAGIIRNQAQLVFHGGVKIDLGSKLILDNQSQIQPGNIVLNGGHLDVFGPPNPDTSTLRTGVSVLKASTIKIAEGVLFVSDNLSLHDSFTIDFQSSDSRFEVGSLFLDNESTLTGLGTFFDGENWAPRLLLKNLYFNEQNQDKLILNNFTIEINNCISNTERARIDETNGTFVMSSALEITNDSYLLNSDLQCPIKLNNAKICVTETAAIYGEMTLLGDVDIHIAPGKTMTYGGVNPIRLSEFQLSILGGGRFFADKQHSNGIELNHGSSRLVLADQGSSVSHLKVAQNGQGSKIQVRSNYAGGVSGNFSCDAFVQGNSGNITIEHFQTASDSIIEMEQHSSLKLENTFQVADNQTLELTQLESVSGTEKINLLLGDKLELSGTLKLNHQARLSGGSIKIDDGLLDVKDNSSIESSILLQNQGGTISLDSGKSLDLESNLGIGNGQKLSLEGGANANLNFENDSHLQNQGTLELDAENLTLTGDNASFEAGSQLLVLQSATFANTPFNLSGTTVEILENAGLTFDNSTVELSQSSIDLQTGASLQFNNSTLEWQGQLSKTGDGSLSLDEVRLTGDASYLGSSQASIRLLNLDNHGLALESHSSSLRLSDRVFLSGSDSELKSNLANLILEKGLELSAGKLSSTGGRIEIRDNLTSTDGTLDLTDSTLALDGTWNQQGGAVLFSGNTLQLLDNLSLQASTSLTFQDLDLEENVLTLLGSSTSLEILSALTIDKPSEGIVGGSGTLIFKESLTLNPGTLSSNGGALRLEKGMTLSGGNLEIPNSNLVIGNHFSQSGGTTNLTGTNLVLFSDLTFDSVLPLSIQSLDLNQKKLTLAKAESDFEIQSQLLIDDANEALITKDADLDLNQGVHISQGSMTSTGGEIKITDNSIFKGGEISISSGKLSVTGTTTFNGSLLTISNGILSLNGLSSLSDGIITILSGTIELGGEFTKNGGTFSLGDSAFTLLSDLTWNSDSPLEINALELNDKALTLGSDTSDLKIKNALTLDQASEKLISRTADLEFTESLSISNGELSSSGGEIRLNKGFDLSGGEIKIFNSSLFLGSETGNAVSLVHSGGTFDDSSSSLQLLQNTTLESTLGLTFQALDLNSRELTLVSGTSDLTLKDQLILDDISEKILTGSADLNLEGGIQMSTGEISSSGGTLALSSTSPNLFQSDAFVVLVNTNLSSVTSFSASLTLDGEPNLSMEGGSISFIDLNMTDGTIGTISTRDGVTCTESCSGFNETGSYGLNTHGLYRNVISANWKLSEADGERKNAQISVKLLSRPKEQVTVYLSSSDISEVTMDSYSLTFDENNWNQLQTITLTGEDDFLADGDIRVRVIGYTNSDDSEYQSVDEGKKHAFKYIFTNLNDDIQVGLSPIAKIAPDQMINEGARVILDGSASYDPDPAGWISKYIWSQTTTEELTLQRADQSIANFFAPQIDVDTMSLVFQLAVQDNDESVGYATTSITVMDTVQLAALVTGGVAPVLPKNLDYVSNTNADGSESISVTAPSGGSNQTELKTDGSAVNRFMLPDGTLSQMNIPAGVSFNLNRDASTSVEMTLPGDATLYSQVAATGEMSIGVSSDGKGVNVKAPSGANLQIGADGTSSIASPPQTNDDGSVTSITTQLNPDGSLQIDLGSSASSSSANAKSSSTASLTTEPGLALSVDTSDGINVSTKVGDATLSTSMAGTGTSNTTFISSSSTTSFATSLPMDVKVRSGGTIESTSSGNPGLDGVSRVLTSSVGSSGVTSELQGSGEQSSKIISSEGSTVTYSNLGVVQSTFDNGSTHSSMASINTEGEIDTRITKISDNSKFILPRVSQGATVDQQADKISISVPLGNYVSGRNGSRISDNGFQSESRFSSRSGVYSQYAVSGFWVGWDSISGKPVYVEPLGSDAKLLIENSYDTNTSISLTSGSAQVRIGDSYKQTLSARNANASGGSLSVSSIPAKISLDGPRNLISMPVYLTIEPSDFEVRFGSYKTVWIYRNQTWFFFTTDSSLKSGYISKGYLELTESIEPGEGFWIELNSPANPTHFEMESRGSYRMLPQFSFTSEEWTLAGAAEKISVEDITKAANFNQSSEDDENTLGLIDTGSGSPPSILIGLLEPSVPSIRRMLLFLGFASLLWYFSVYARRFSKNNSNRRIRMLQTILVSGLLFGLAACAPPQSDDSMYTVPYSGSRDRLHSIWKWDSSNSKWMAYSPKTTVAEDLESQGYSSFSTVQPGEGFWVRISQSNLPESMGFSEPPAF